MNVNWLLSLPESERRAFQASLTPQEAKALEHSWEFWARPAQLAPPGSWTKWLINAGRGFGKTRSAAEWIRKRAESGKGRRIILVGDTAADVRDTMVEGESGILAISPPWFRPRYEPSKRKLSWPNGAVAKLYSAEDPEQLRGPQCDTFWVDELAKWQYAQEAWDQLMFGFRLSDDPRGVISTTPRPIDLMRELLKGSVKAAEMTAGRNAEVVVSGGSTYDNLANLSPQFRAMILARYEGSRLGRQELDAELLEDVEGALWTYARIELLRVDEPPVSGFIRIVVAVDPATTAGPDSDETGIIVAGLGWDRQAYILEDLSGRYGPDEWAHKVVDAYWRWQADRVVAEVNQGGDLVERNLRTVDANLSYAKVHAKRGKALRAEPVASLYEQGRVHHVGDHVHFKKLNDQLAGWVPGSKADSPDRLDALVYAVTELLVEQADGRKAMVLEYLAQQKAEQEAAAQKQAEDQQAEDAPGSVPPWPVRGAKA